MLFFISRNIFNKYIFYLLKMFVEYIFILFNRLFKNNNNKSISVIVELSSTKDRSPVCKIFFYGRPVYSPLGYACGALFSSFSHSTVLNGAFLFGLHRFSSVLFVFLKSIIIFGDWLINVPLKFDAPF